MTELRRPLEAVTDTTTSYYGGSQMWCENKLSRGYGCGVVAATQLSLHLQKPGSELSKEDFLASFDAARPHFLILPYLGLNGFLLCHGTRRLLRKSGIKVHMHWGVWPGKIWDRTREMLEADIPVILSVGPNTIPFSKRHQVTLYSKRGEAYVPCTRTFGHYVTITAIEDKWIKISSWGNCYYINSKEYENYARRYSNWLYSNILYITRE